MTEHAFSDLSHDSQYVFRAVLTALSEPGRVVALEPPCSPPAPLDPAAAAVILALCDMDTPLWLHATQDFAADYFRFHTGAPVVSRAREASFLLASPCGHPNLSHLACGSAERPDASATLVIPVADLEQGPGWRLSGPGIETETSLRIAGVDEAFFREWQENHRLYPRGVDVIFAARRRIAGLPRSTRLEV